MKFETDLNITSYTNVVKEIVDAHYSSKGEYIPHYGRIITMMLFFRMCAKDTHYTIDEEKQIESFDKIFADPEFQKAFDKELHSAVRRNVLSFNQAYYDAQKIIEARNSSMATFVESITDVITGAVKAFSEAMSDGTLEQLTEIATKYSEMNVSTEKLADVIVEKYAEKLSEDEEESFPQA